MGFRFREVFLGHVKRICDPFYIEFTRDDIYGWSYFVIPDDNKSA